MKHTAVMTLYTGPRDGRGARIITMIGTEVSFYSYDHGKTLEENHAIAALKALRFERDISPQEEACMISAVCPGPDPERSAAWVHIL